MKNTILKFLLFFGLFLALSCGTRKTKKTVIEEETKTESEISEKKEESKEEIRKTEKEENSDIEETTENLTPIDPDKPMKKTVEEKDGKKITTWENASVNSGTKTDKSIKSESVDEVVKSDFKRESDFKTVQEVKKTDKAKVTESNKGFAISYWWVLLLLIPLAVWKFYNIKNKFR